MYGKILINPQLLRDESIAIILNSGSKEEEVVDKDKPLSFIEQH